MGEFARRFWQSCLNQDGTVLLFLSVTITSPNSGRQWQEVQKAYPKAKACAVRSRAGRNVSCERDERPVRPDRR